MQRILAWEIREQIYDAIKKHNDALSDQVAEGEITYDQFLVLAFPANALSVIDKAFHKAWEKSNAD